MDEIRTHNVKLNHVNVNDAKGKAEMTVDISDMNKEERNDHIENLRIKLQMRKKALNRRGADSDDDDWNITRCSFVDKIRKNYYYINTASMNQSYTRTLLYSIADKIGRRRE